MKASSTNNTAKKTLLILCTTTGYETRAFVEAAEKLNLAIVFGSDRCHGLDDPWQDGALALRFEDPEDSARLVVERARASRIDGIVSLGDRPAPTAARACQALRLPHHPTVAADACQDKYFSREKLRQVGLSVPLHKRFVINSDMNNNPDSGGAEILFPCVLKPLFLSGSRGVIRANTPQEFTAAFERIRALLASPDVQVLRKDTSHYIQVESYVEGVEIAVEGLVDRGRLQVLAIFDKRDPLTGPYFEETTYVTPSRLAPETQAAATVTLGYAVHALGLYHGPLCAELRLNSRGVWVMEVAARSFSGLCSRALRFHSPGEAKMISLEGLLIRLALGEPIHDVRREDQAAGVMMIPILEAGIFDHVEGVDLALQTPGVEDIQITAKPNQKLVPLPEGSSYLGFIFARGGRPKSVEDALREAHRKLRRVIQPPLRSF